MSKKYKVPIYSLTLLTSPHPTLSFRISNILQGCDACYNWHTNTGIIINSSPRFRFHSLCCVILHVLTNAYPYIHCYSIIQNTSTDLNNLCSTYSSFPPQQNPWQPLVFSYLHSFAYTRMSYSWNYTIRRLFRLASYT